MEKGIRESPASSPTRYVLTFDLGSGSHKVAIVTDTGRVMASTSESVTTRLLPNGGAEQDPEEWWRGAKAAARRVVVKSNIAPKDIVAVSCDSQWSVVVAVDQNGEALMPAIHWLDTRGAPYNREITRGFPSVQGYGMWRLWKWITRAGFPPTHSGIDSMGHVLFIKNERPDIYAKTYKFLEPMDYLTARLTGRITATQKTMAPFLITDNRRLDGCQYSDELLKLAGLEKAKFPELIPNDGIVGPLKPSVAEELGLLPGTQVVAGTGDAGASIVGSGAVQDFDPIIYIGTSLFMTCHLPFKKTDVAHAMTTLPSPFKSKYYLFGEQGAGGKCVDFFLNNIIYADDDCATGPPPDNRYERFNTTASQAPAGSGGVIFLPWLNGTIVPQESPHVRGGFMNLSLNTTRQHMARAVMEGLAYNSRWTRGPAEKFVGRPFKRFLFSGGGALSDLWAQIHADVLNIPIHQAEDPVNATVRGAALLALVSLGYRRLEDIPRLIPIKHIYEPDTSNRLIYDRMYRQYRAFFKKNKRIYTALNAPAIVQEK